MSLNLAQFFRTDQPQAAKSVGFATLAQLFESRKFLLFGGHNHFSANLMWNAVLPAEFHHRRGSRHAQSCFQRTWLVINAGVNDTAVVPTLMAGHTIFLFKHQQALLRKTPRNFQRDDQSHDTAANHYDVVARICHPVSDASVLRRTSKFVTGAFAKRAPLRCNRHPSPYQES